MKRFRFTALERAWILYDVGNSAFILMVATLIPIYFNSIAAAAGISSSEYLAYWGYAGSLSTLIVAFIAPIFGAAADRENAKKPIFLISVCLGAVGCACLGLPLSWIAFLAVYVVAKVGFSSSLVFYDAMLPEITAPERMDRVSAHGYAFGYIGSCIPFVLGLALVLLHGTLGLSAGGAMSAALVLVALWWVAATLPLMRKYRQTAFSQLHDNLFQDSFVKLWHTVRDVAQDKCVLWFMLAFFFYIDGVYTIIDMATAYGAALGLNTNGLLLALLLTQIVAFPSSIAFGRFSARYDTGKLIQVCIFAYTAITVFAVFLASQWQFWVLAVGVGLFQGGIQALSRSYFAKVIPPEKSGEYFGLFDICGKGASFLGTLLISLGSHLTGRENVGVGALVVLFCIGLVCFRKADRLYRASRANPNPGLSEPGWNGPDLSGEG